MNPGGLPQHPQEECRRHGDGTMDISPAPQ